MKDGFAYVDECVSGLRWDAVYATAHNFTGAVVDGYEVNRIVGTRELCTALTAAQERAVEQGFGLFLWDGYRPQRAVDRFIRWADEPEDGRGRERFHPRIDRHEMFEKGYVATRSGHSRGSTVDLTLYHLNTGILTEMGGGHDLMDVVSHHGVEGIPAEAIRNRETLCDLMEASGFAGYAYEWWHYSLRDEPYPETYFDFPVT